MSSLTTVTNNKQIKDGVSNIKQKIESGLDRKGRGLLILQCELLQRGVIFVDDNNKSSNDDTTTIMWDALERYAGKVSILSTLPIQLQMAVHAIMGMAIESYLQQEEDTTNDTPKKVLKRCKDVGDSRMALWIRLLSSTTSTLVEECWRKAGMEEFLQAGHCQSHIPIMWKRALLISMKPTEYMALAYLIQIAKSKQNIPRILDLSIQLMDSYLSMDNTRNNSSEQDEGLFKETCQVIEKHTKSISNSKRLLLARQTMQDISSSIKQHNQSTETQMLAFHTMKLRLETQWRFNLVQDIYQTQLDTYTRRQEDSKNNALNTKQSKSKSKSKSIKNNYPKPCQNKILQQLLSLKKNHDDKLSLEYSSSSKLFDQYLPQAINCEAQQLLTTIVSNTTSQNTAADKDTDESSMEESIKSIIQHLQQNLQNIPFHSNPCNEWEHLQTMATTILLKLNKHLNHEELQQCAAQTFIVIFWMNIVNSNNPQKDQNMIDTNQFQTLMNQCHDIIKSSLEKYHSSKNEERSYNEEEKCDDHSNKAKELEFALTSVECISYLWNLKHQNALEDEEKDAEFIAKTIQQLTATTTKDTGRMNNEKQQGPSLLELQAKYGTYVWQTWICWSGWWGNHPISWPNNNVTQVRFILDKVAQVFAHAKQNWNRTMHKQEELFLSILQADTEQLNGNFQEAETLYKQLISTKTTKSSSLLVESLVQTHGHLGLAKMQCLNDKKNNDWKNINKINEKSTFHTSTEATQQQILNDCEENINYCYTTLTGMMNKMKASDSNGSYCSYIWTHHPESFQYISMFAQCQICLGRQIMADACIQYNQMDKARTFLLQASKDSPKDYNSAFALGSFLLRSLLYSNVQKDDKDLGEEIDQKKAKDAQIQLLKAAKLGRNKHADPFALLGIWYEIVQKDFKRAKGCHSKALLINPTHPIAGRAIVRLLSNDDGQSEVKRICTNATNIISSPQKGWAWNALGEHRMKNKNDTDHDGAITCFQNALRCRDIENSQSDNLSIFYNLPHLRHDVDKNENCAIQFVNEVGMVWSNLALCYHHLEKYTAALKAFNIAYEMTNSRLPSNILFSWAEVELELELYLEATSKFKYIFQNDTDIVKQNIAASGLGKGMLCLARKSAIEGKYSAARRFLQEGIDVLFQSVEQQLPDDSAYRHGCAFKLVGDLFSFGIDLPPYVFNDCSNEANNHAGIEKKIGFVAKGETYYKKAADIFQTCSMSPVPSDDLKSDFLALAFCDIGINILQQAKLILECTSEGSEIIVSSRSILGFVKENDRLRTLLERSVQFFKKSIEIDDLLPDSWCGLGCALTTTSPITAQHCFCRALQIEKTHADAWTNLYFLFLEYGVTESSPEVIDILTQIIDSPLTWIGRAISLERDSFSADDNEEVICDAMNAYRSALQTCRHSSALLGSSLMNCRLKEVISRRTTKRNSSDKTASKYFFAKESLSHMATYLKATGDSNIRAKLLYDLMQYHSNISGVHNNAALQESLQAKLSLLSNTEDLIERCATLSLVDKCEKDNLFLDEKKIVPYLGFNCSKISDLSQIISKYSHQYSNQPQNLDSQDIEIKPKFHCNFDTRTKLHLEPENGLHWLNFSKELILTFVTTKDRRNNEAIFTVTDKAKKLLQSQSREISHEESISWHGKGQFLSKDYVNAVSDAYALSSWVNFDFKEDKISSSRELEAYFDIQRSLLLNPENAFARRKICKLVELSNDELS